jgi:cell division protein FtsB
MNRSGLFKSVPKEQIRQGLALALLLILAALAIAGPTGLLTWNDQANLLEQRQQQITELAEQRDELRNRVELLDTESADPDLVGELLRENLNVVHPDEVVITIEEE